MKPLVSIQITMTFEIGAIMFGLLTLFAGRPANAQEAVAAAKRASARFQPKNAFFYFDAESQKDGAPVPQPPFFPSPWKEADAEHPKRGRVVADPTAPQGKQIFRWDVAEPKTKEIHHEVKFSRLPEAKPKEYYYAFFVRFDRKGGNDIWHGGEGDSFDKGFEIIGEGIRWIVHFGNHDMRLRDHTFSCFVSNATYHLNRDLELYDGYYQNHGDFSRPHSSRYDSVPLDYEKWHAMVFKMKWATDSTGEVALWANGKKVLEYKGIKTVNPPGTFERVQIWGTIAQPAYDAPPHVRKVDALLFTDDWKEIENGGYLRLPGTAASPTTRSTQR